MDGDFTHLCNKHITTHTDDVTYIEQTFENSIVHGFVFARANIIAFEIQLYSSFRILQLTKRSSAHDAPAHDTACNAYILQGRFIFPEIAVDEISCRIYLKGFRWIRVDTQVIHFF